MGLGSIATDAAANEAVTFAGDGSGFFLAVGATMQAIVFHPRMGW